jgi:hypothetical protein
MIITSVLVVLTVFFMVNNLSVKEFPWWAIIGVPIVILGSPFVFFLAQRSVKRTVFDAS